jgi:hypothetical protein
MYHVAEHLPSKFAALSSVLALWGESHFIHSQDPFFCFNYIASAWLLPPFNKACDFLFLLCFLVNVFPQQKLNSLFTLLSSASQLYSRGSENSSWYAVCSQ